MTGNNLLTHSRMATYKTCPRKHYFAYEVGLRREQASQPLRMGAAFALGREQPTIEQAVDAVRLNYSEMPAWADIDEWMTECEKVVRLLVGHRWRWGNDGLEVVAAELPFQLPLINPDTGAASRTFMLAGKIDAIVRLADGRLAIREDKTTSDDISPDSDYWKRLRIDQQISMYMYAARKLGHQVETIIYDVTRKPGISPRKLTKAELSTIAATGLYCDEPGVVGERETPAMYGARLNADIAERPDFYFARMEIPRLASDMIEFEAELWQIGQQVLQARNGDRWFRNTNACLHPYKCEMWELCSQGVNNINRDEPAPTGFAFIENIHPELPTGAIV